MSSPCFHYWGKSIGTCPPESNRYPGWHLLPYHCLDVAAVGVVYLRRAPNVCMSMMQALGVSSEAEMEAWFGFCLALHDIGKFSEAFQSQKPDLFHLLRRRSPDPGRPYVKRHDSLGWLVWCEVLRTRAINHEWFGAETEDRLFGVDWWLRAVTGHHGQPPSAGLGDNWRQHFHPDQDISAIDDFVAGLFTLFFENASVLPSQVDAEVLEQSSKVLSWWVAGIAVLADWLGSNTDFFPYRADPVSFAEYWEYSLVQADKALNESGVLPIRCAEQLDFSELFPAIVEPSPLQRWAASVPLRDEPQIHLLEDVTGAGKTEAAVTLAHRMMSSGCADGFFVGLPTMATANAMYGRIAQVYSRLFAGVASLALAHGQRNLVEAFAESIIPAGSEDRDHQQLDDTATLRCAAWLADHNKRALLASAGVGTVDQALLAVLYSKHQSLRLLGLFRKVLIVDEVHACDVYMQRVLETLLEFHAHAGGSAILLSATLPQRMKQAFLNAFARGRGLRRFSGVQSQKYPLVTSSYGDGSPPDERAIDTRGDVCRDLAVHYVSEEDVVVQAIESALASGKCVCWMRNTIKDALAAYARFRDKLPAECLILFHARFALRDRLDIEERILSFFGKDSTPEKRAGRLVVATQVAEQSLDADWDFVVTDLAPIDRVIQRAGRLQRHPRNREGRRLKDPLARDQRGQPCLWVFGPPWSDEPQARWFKDAFPAAAGVYPHHGQLWLTARALREGVISMPGDARRLIESVFGDSATIPAGLGINAEKTEGKDYADASLAQQNTIKLIDGYTGDGIDWWSEAKTPSRLGEASMTVLLGRWEGNRLRPWVSHKSQRHAWAYSSVRVAERLIAQRKEEEDPVREAAVQELLETLPGGGKWSVLLALSKEKVGCWVGQALGKAAAAQPAEPRWWSYDPGFGLVEREVSGSGGSPDTDPA